jgi:hypothetical protein
MALTIVWLTAACQMSTPNYDQTVDQDQFPLLHKYYKDAGGIDPAGILKPFSSEDINSSRWGIQFNLLPPHVNKYPEDFQNDTLLDQLSVLLKRASKLGVKWARVSVNWSTIEDHHGNYHWEYLDSTLHGLKKIGIEPYVCLNGGHDIYTSELPPTKSEVGMKSWLSFVKLISGRYENLVDYWEIWNEPNYPSFWKPEPDAEKYVKLVKETAFTIKEYDRSANIIGGSLARMDLPFAEKMFEAGIAGQIDILTVHPYNAIPTGSVKKIGYPVRTPHYYIPSSHQFKDFRELLAQYDPSIEIWQAECGYPSAQNSHGWTGTGPWGENIQAKWLLRRMITDVSQGVRVSAYFSLWEYKLNPDDRVTNRKGLLDLKNMKPKQSYFTFQNLTALFRSSNIQNKDIQRRFQINHKGSFRGIWEENIQSYSITVGDKSFFCYWLPWRISEFIKPAEVNIKLGISDMKDPVLLDLLTGQVYHITKNKQDGDFQVLQNLPLTDYPLVITERGDITIR